MARNIIFTIYPKTLFLMVILIYCGKSCADYCGKSVQNSTYKVQILCHRERQRGGPVMMCRATFCHRERQRGDPVMMCRAVRHGLYSAGLLRVARNDKKMLYRIYSNDYNGIMKNFHFYVYIMANRRNGTIYVGITNDIVRRVYEHKKHLNPDSFTARYNCDKLVYFEDFQYSDKAIEREKQLKAGSRANKIALIESINPDWCDLSAENLFWMR